MNYGLVKTSLVDYPEHVAGVLFYTGCNMRCPYCHNPQLAAGEKIDNGVDIDGLRSYLEKRRNVLDGIVITGGEPTVHSNLQRIIHTIKDYDLKVKLDTNGLRPDVLKFLDGVDFIAMDLKTSPERYELLLDGQVSIKTHSSEIADTLNESIQYILQSGVEHQFRTTLIEEIVSDEDMEEICIMIKDCMSYRLTPFRPGNTLMKNFTGNTSKEYLDRMVEICNRTGIPVTLEG